MTANKPTIMSRALIRMSPRKKTMTMKLPIRSSAEKAMESGMVRMRCQKVRGGITWARVLSMSAETGTTV